ncbi:MAG: hypothetical protein EP343_20610 [Deltaproteobacteria bacterium]|nr:MAG: hypothetical protein EP343_20610 [Deltaproteobacteria bacterium]
MTEPPHFPPTPTSDPALEILQRWLSILRQRVSRHTFRMLARAMVVLGFLGSAYVLGWGTIPVHAGWSAYSQLLVFPLFGVGLFWFSRQLDDVNIDWDRWWKVLPAGFFFAALRHLFHSWTLALAVWGLSACLGLGFRALRQRRYPTKERLKEAAWDNLILLVLLTNLFLPRALFASFVVFLPIVLLVVFYNFILERDRLQRAKALAVGAPPNWLRRANKLLPSSTYLFLLLPGLLFAEAFVFHAVYQTTHSIEVRKQDPFRPPNLRDWLVFTLSAKMKAKPRRRTKKILSKQEVIYRELGRGYSLTASLLRGFLIFFYAKRLLLIFLLLMEKTLGLRVHRIGEINGEDGARGRLEEVRQVLLRTLDSFPRAWAGLFLRGVQGKHGALDPIGTLIRNIQWFRSEFLPRIIPGMKAKATPSEADWSRLVREEQISLLGQMQDRTWVIESFIDMVSPPHSSTIRGKIYYYTNIPGLRPFVHFYMKPPEPEVRARLIEEIPNVIARAIATRGDQIVLSDVENDVLTQEQVWTLRDRALTVLGDLTQNKEPMIKAAAVQAIGAIAKLERPALYNNPQIWAQLSNKLAPFLKPDSKAPSEDDKPKQQPKKSETRKEEENTPTSPSEQEGLPEPLYPDPFQRLKQVTSESLHPYALATLGTLGVRRSAVLLSEHYPNTNHPLLVLQSLGMGGKGSGQEDSGFPVAEEFLLRTATQSENPEETSKALSSLVRLSFPYPIATSYNLYLQEAAQAETIRHGLQKLESEREKLETLRANDGDATDRATKEELRHLYQSMNGEAARFEQQALLVLQRLADTFWATLHYSAAVVIAAYNAGEGLLEESDFSEYLEQMSLEDPQGWREWMAHFPQDQDTSTLYAPYIRFFDWLASSHKDNLPNSGYVFEQFLSLQNANPIRSNTSEDERWQDVHELCSRFESHLQETLLQWTSCLPYRPRSFYSFASEETKEPQCWQVTLTGTTPWLTPLMDLPDHATAGELSLSFEQVSPLSLTPVVKVTWDKDPKPEDFRHGHSPDVLVWGHNFYRAPQTHLRQLNTSENREYWRAPELLEPEEEWLSMLRRLLSQKEFRSLDSLDANYVLERSQASFQQVFLRSRLREQDALMIVRDAAVQLDHFVAETGKSAAQLFLLSGQRGLGHTTLLLQHARSVLRNNKDASQPSIVFYLDVGQMGDDQHLAEWLFRELQIEPSKKLAKQLRNKPMDALGQALAQLSKFPEPPHRLVLYVDGFHEKPAQGPSWVAQCFTAITKFGKKFPWFRLVMGIRQTFYHTLAQHPELKPWKQNEALQLPEGLCYRDLTSLHDQVVELTPFQTQPPVQGGSTRSELVRAYHRFFNFVDTSGAHRYRPQLKSLDELDPFGLTYSLLTYPALLPLVLETFHKQELPSDLHILQLLQENLKPYSDPELRFLRSLARWMLFGTPDKTPSQDPKDWTSDALLLEVDLLQHPALLEFVEPYKYGVSVYESLRNRGVLIRQWRTQDQQSWFRRGPQEAQRHVTFTSHQLLEYLLHEALLDMVSQAPGAALESQTSHSVAHWLLNLADYSLTFQPLEGALILLLTHLLERRQVENIAEFVDLASRNNVPADHLFLESLSLLSPSSLLHGDSPLEGFLVDLSENDLLVFRQLGQRWSRRGLFAEVESLFRMVLEHPDLQEPLEQFPSLYHGLLLERADNKRRFLTQQAGGQLSATAYQEGRRYYERALERIQKHEKSLEDQARGYRLLALYERDTHRLNESLETLQTAWDLLKNHAETTTLQMEKAWIRHLQSAVLVKRCNTEEHPDTEKISLLEQAKQWSEEAMKLLPKTSTPERMDLQPKIFDNAARCLMALSKLSEAPQEAASSLDTGIRYLTQSVQSKRSLHDMLGLAMSMNGLGESYRLKASLTVQEGTKEQQENWKQSESYYKQALTINQAQLQSKFGEALTYEALSELYFQHPERHKDGINALVQALLAYESAGASAGSGRVLKSLVLELAELPVNELYRFVKFVVAEIQQLHSHSEKLIQTLWNELQTVLGESLPGMIGELFTTKSSSDESSTKSQS